MPCRIIGERREDEFIDVTGGVISDSHLIECILILKAPQLNAYICDNVFDCCTFVGDGWPFRPAESPTLPPQHEPEVAGKRWLWPPQKPEK